MPLERNARKASGRIQAVPPHKPDSGHAGTVSITLRVRRTSRNAMKPRIQCVLI
jgi:hypothetical protein